MARGVVFAVLSAALCLLLLALSAHHGEAARIPDRMGRIMVEEVEDNIGTVTTISTNIARPINGNWGSETPAQLAARLTEENMLKLAQAAGDVPVQAARPTGTRSPPGTGSGSPSCGHNQAPFAC